MAIETIPGRLFAQGTKLGNKPAYYIKQGGTWNPTSWATYADEVKTAAKALIALGFKPRDTVNILGFNHPEWVIFDLAGIAAGGAAAGIYTTCSPEEVQYIVEHSEAEFVLIENAEQWAKIKAQLGALPRLKHVVTMKSSEPIEHELVISWDAFMAKAEGVSDEQLQERLDSCDDDQTATFIYTSGTTGPPKAVMLTHKNLTWTATAATQLAQTEPGDCTVSYLPLCHIAEQMFTIHAPITGGYAVYYAESIPALPDNLKEVQPTVILGVPRIWEKMHAKVAGRMADATGLKARIAKWAMKVGTQVSAKKNRGEEVRGLLAVKYKLADKLVFSKVKPLMGLSRARMCVTGAAPIAAEVLEFFAALDIQIHEVYGQSEDSGPTTFNLAGDTKYGTVGKPLQGSEVKIAEDGEILVQGPHVFKGYYKDEAATNETLIDGWLYSGDLGSYDEDGFLRITGRKKEIIITAGGKNIAPKNIEAQIKNHPLVSQAVVIGDRRKYLSALITLDPEAIVDWCRDQGVSEPPHESGKVLAEIQNWVDNTVNPQFARVEHIRKFRLLPRDFSIEDGELTGTLKIKRRIVNQNWTETIEAIYAEDEAKASA